MKKLLSFILSLAMLLSIAVMPAFAEEVPAYSSDQAKKLISKISGVDASKISANLGQRYDAPGQAWNLYFYDNLVNVSATVDATTGELVNYGYYLNYYPGDKNDNVPNYTRDELIDTALDFIKEYAPDKYDKIDKKTDYQYGSFNYKSGQTVYFYHFKRNLDQFKDLNQGIDISVDATTGKVCSFNLNWTDIDKIDMTGVLSEEEASKRLDEVMGTYLVQAQIWRDGKGSENRLLYEPANNAGIYPLPMGIDAKTGAPVSYNGDSFEAGKREEYSVNNAVVLESLGKMDEKKAKDFAEQYLKDIGRDPSKAQLGVSINDGYLYNGENLKVYNIYGNYGDEKGSFNFSAVIDSETGRILNLSYGEWPNMPGSPQADGKGVGMDKAVEIAKDYISRFKLPFKNALVVSGKDYNYTVNFIMYEDGVLYPMNSVNVNINNEGNIVGFNMNFSAVDKPDTSGVITLEKAKEVLSKYQKLQLSFVIPRDNYTGNPKGDPIPVYQLSYINGYGIDAKTGEFVGYDNSAKPVPEDEKFDPYGTVRGDKNERVLKIFIDTGIMPQPIPAPTEKATAGQAAQVLFKAFTPGYYAKPMMEGAADASPEGNALEALKDYGVIKEDVKPSDTVTRAQLALWLARATGYDKLTNSDVAFSTTVKDIDGLGKEIKNSIAIVTSLKVMDAENGKFKPDDPVTFSDFCAAVYNAMKNM
ncbi:YcdB/YcdC domain-containing protein [Calorimonas adulescens]|uniref:Peptidase n=1 Tax=Calorimonas adulescens TaxID=2606906 RepID=A0A5D8QBW9_9THEO|nr:YcdB/YcdC domain-containing protein [Calorimonas adulescens]TZE81023.1 hypothetical protein FWJ32_11005 [Calorimonas adulescens]